MAFNGYFVKIKGVNGGLDWTIPMDYMKSESYVGLLSGQDLDSYRDADGTLHRTGLKNVIPKVEFEIPPMTNDKLNLFFTNLKRRYTNKIEKKLRAEVYMSEIDDYVTHDFYVPDINFTIYKVEGKEILYNATRVAFISYGGEINK